MPISSYAFCYRDVMRAPVDPAKMRRVLEAIGRRCRGPGRIYLTGGGSAVLVGWRQSTVDVDLKLDPEPAGAFEAIAEIKHDLDVNLELASPDAFVPVPADWRARSPFIVRHGQVDFYHFDFRAQALAKLARGYERDVADVRAMEDEGLVAKDELRAAFEEVKSDLLRYPGLNAEAFERRVDEYLGPKPG